MTNKTGIVLEGDPNEKMLRMLYAQHLEQQQQSAMLKDYSNPVDEYEYNTSAIGAASLPVNIQPAFSSPVRIESVTVVLPSGITAAQIQLGKRVIPLLSAGAATTDVTVRNLVNLGIILVGSDDRFLTWTGAATSGYYVALSGYQNNRA